MEETKGVDFRAILRTAIRVIASPAAFFQDMPKTGGFGEPLVFMMVMGVTAGIVNAVLSIVGLHIGMGVGKALASIIIHPLVIAVLGFIWSAIVFVLWKLMGSHEPYETAYRCSAYITALWPIAMALKVIPHASVLVVIAIGVCVYVIASIKVHNISSRRAWLVFGIIGAIFIVMSLGAIIAQRATIEETMKYRKQLEQSTGEIQKDSEEARRAFEETQMRLENK